MQIVGVAKSSSKKNEQAEYVETIQMAFEATLMVEIVSRDDRTWEVYADNMKNREAAFVQKRVMLTVLQNTLKQQGRQRRKSIEAKGCAKYMSNIRCGPRCEPT